MFKASSKRLAIVTGFVVVGLAAGFSVPETANAQSRTRPVKLEEQLEFGVEMAKRGLWNEALFRFKRAAQLGPSQGRILNNLAVAYEAVGEFELAMEHYKKALDADPGNSNLKKNYSRFVEFYQGFRPDGPAQDASSSPEQATDDSGTAGAAEAQGTQATSEPDGALDTAN